MDRLAGKMLIAMPAMGDPRFHRAVLLVCAHDDGGAMGLVINRPLPGLTFRAMLEQLNLPCAAAGLAPSAAVPDIPVLAGGPVEATRGFILHSAGFAEKDTIRITGDIAITGTVDALRAVADGQGPQQMLFVLGYAGWSPGQLEQEIQENVWLIAESDPALIFSRAFDEKWSSAIKTIGVDLAMLSGEAGRA